MEAYEKKSWRTVDRGELDDPVREDERQVPTILLQTADGNSPVWLLSTDAGVTWTKLSLKSAFFYAGSYPDYGGPYVRANYNPIRIGTRDFPFVLVPHRRRGHHADQHEDDGERDQEGPQQARPQRQSLRAPPPHGASSSQLPAGLIM